MSKKNKPVEVEVNERKNNKGDRVDLEVIVKKKVIATLEKAPEDKDILVKMASGRERHVKSIDEGIQTAIAEYNLHDS